MMELAALLTEAQTASPMHRIEWRDRIADHGGRAIEAVKPWLSSPVLAGFAIRVIERAGTNGDVELASKVLRSARSKVPETYKDDVRWALRRLRIASLPAAGAPESTPPTKRASRASLLHRELPYLSTVARRRAR
ncbi:MAG: hypothetical protein ACXWXV_11250 [Aeromicrobium sp.]